MFKSAKSQRDSTLTRIMYEFYALEVCSNIWLSRVVETRLRLFSMHDLKLLSFGISLVEIAEGLVIIQEISIKINLLSVNHK